MEAIVGVAALLVGIPAGIVIYRAIVGSRVSSAESLAERRLVEADREAETKVRQALVEVKEEIAAMRREAEEDVRTRREEIRRQEERLAQKEESLDRRMAESQKRVEGLDRRDGQLEKARRDLTLAVERKRTELENVARMTSQEARDLLMRQVIDGAKREAMSTVREIEQRAREEGEKRARKIVTIAIQRVASEQTAESTVAVIRLLGRLQYRTSYGQNVLRHLVESAHIAAALAAELGTDLTLAKRCALLHDIGKAVTHEVEGSHALIGAEIARRLKEAPEVVHAIESHHGEVEQRTVEAVLAQTADAISGSRPGARRESLETYVKRLERLEQICESYPGVEKTFAMQAGREVRVMVKPDDVDDLSAQVLARDIAKQVEEELQYPGQIKITVVRETRSVEYAK